MKTDDLVAMLADHRLQGAQPTRTRRPIGQRVVRLRDAQAQQFSRWVQTVRQVHDVQNFARISTPYVRGGVMVAYGVPKSLVLSLPMPST